MSRFLVRNFRRLGMAIVAGVMVGGCALLEPPRAPPQAPPPSISIARLYDQPAERSFINGMRFYEDGQYERAEVMFKRALAEGLRDPYDVAAANNISRLSHARIAGLRNASQLSALHSRRIRISG